MPFCNHQQLLMAWNMFAQSNPPPFLVKPQQELPHDACSITYFIINRLGNLTIIFAQGCSTSISFRIVAPSFVIVASPITSVPMPCCPQTTLHHICYLLGSGCLFSLRSLPLFSLFSSFRIKTGISPTVVIFNFHLSR